MLPDRGRMRVLEPRVAPGLWAHSFWPRGKSICWDEIDVSLTGGGVGKHPINIYPSPEYVRKSLADMFFFSINTSVINSLDAPGKINETIVTIVYVGNLLRTIKKL